MQGVIVRRNPDQFIPDAFAELVIKNNNAAFGAAVIDGDNGLLTSSGGKEDLTLEFIKETQQSYADKGITFFFAASEGAINEEDMFPQTILSDDDGNATLCVFVDANLPGFVKKDSSLSAATHFVDDWLRPELSKIAEKIKAVDSEGNIDIPKLMGYCGKDEFRKAILSQAVSRGAITLMSDKTTLTFASGDTAKEFPWGWTSNHYNFGKETAPAPKKKDMFAKKSTVREKAPGTGDQPVIENNTKTSVPSVAAKDGDTALYTIVKQFPGPNVSRNDRKNWYKYRIGYTPKGWEQSVPIEVYVDKQKKLVSWSEFKRSLSNLGLPPLNNPPKPGEESEGDSEPKQVTGDKLPMITPKGRDYMNAELDKPEIKKIIAETGDVVATAEQAKAMEAKIADFIIQLGRKDITIVDLMKLPYEWLHRVCQERPDIGATLAWNWKNMLLPRLAKEYTAPKVEEEPVKSEIVADATETEKKPKRDMFAKKAKAA